MRNDKILSRLHWTEEEQNFLKLLREKSGILSWTTIANQLNKSFQGLYRSGKQCRERYMNYIRFSDCNIKSLGWCQSQDELLFQKFLIHGRKWVEICKLIPGRSQNCIKNRFYGAMRKISRRIVRVFKEKKIKQKKLLKQDAYIKILQCREIVSNAATSIEVADDFLFKLQKDLIQMAIKPQEDIIAEQIVYIVNRIHHFIFISKSKPLQNGKSVNCQHETFNSSDKFEEKEQKIIPEQIQINILPPQQKQGLSPKTCISPWGNMKQDDLDLFELGLSHSEFNNFVSHDLDREISEILNQVYVPPCPLLF